MRLLTSILFPLLLLFTSVPTNATYACGSGGNGNCCDKELKSCCNKYGALKSPCENHKKENRNCDHKGCQCHLVCNNIFVAIVAEVKQISTFKEVIQSLNWHYYNVIPQPVYLSIWLPPKINCQAI